MKTSYAEGDAVLNLVRAVDLAPIRSFGSYAGPDVVDVDVDVELHPIVLSHTSR